MNKLEHLTEFQEILANYQIAPASQHILEKTRLVCLVAVTASGRNTLIRELLKTSDYYFIVSDTTRQPRVNDGLIEKNGDVYWFKSEAEFLAGLRAGQYVEAAIIHQQQVSGSNIREFQLAQSLHKIAITEVDVRGAATFKRLKPDTLTIFILPPNFKEWQRRLHQRGSLTPAELKRRLHSAKTELAAALTHNYYHFVINDDLTQAAAAIQQLVHDQSANPPHQSSYRQLAQQLYNETTTILEKVK